MTINSTTGLYTATETIGITKTIYATLGSLVASASVTISGNPVLTSIVVTPTNINVVTGNTQQFTASARDQNGNPMPTQPTFTWTTNNGSITSTGLLTAGSVAIGRTVTATSGTISGTAIFSSTTIPVLTTITVTPVSVSTAGGATQQYTAVGRDQNNVVMTISPTWTATPVAGTLTAIAVTPNPTTVNSGGTRQFTAVGTDANGNVLSGLTFVWTTTAGTISTTGLLTGPSSGTLTVTATVGSVFGTSAVTVSATTLSARSTIPAASSYILSDDNTGNFSLARQGTGSPGPYFPATNEVTRFAITATQFSGAPYARATVGYLEFDTTSIPTNATISSATLTLYCYQSIANGAGRVIDVSVRDFGTGALTLSDFVTGTTLATLPVIANLTIPSSASSLGTAMIFSGTTLATNIIKAGLTRLIFYDEKSATGTNPTTGDIEINFCSPAHGSPEYRPLLVVVYT